MHMVSKKDLNSDVLETMRTSRSATTVMTANGEVQTREEATVYGKELDFFVTVMLLEETLAVWKLCEDHGCTYHWISGQKPHLIRNGQKNRLQNIQLCTNGVSWFMSEFLLNHTFTYFSNIFITGFRI